jgi:hypothetical protein
MKSPLITGALALLLSVNVHAKEAMCGEYTSVDLGESTLDMGNKVTFMHFRSSTQMLAADGSKFNNLTGQCTGGAVIYPDKTVEASGLCAVEDVDGDVLSYAFTQARGQLEGRYLRKGGTGKFAGSRESGWFKPVKLDGEITRGEWGGKDSCK